MRDARGARQKFAAGASKPHGSRRAAGLVRRVHSKSRMQSFSWDDGMRSDGARLGQAPVRIWNAGPPESELQFSLRHLLFTQILGRASRWKALASIDSAEPARSWVDVVVDASSLETGDAERDEHIRSVEFLDTAVHPEIRFRSREVTALADGDHWTVTGDLTIRQVTLSATVELERDGDPVWTPDLIALKGRAVIDRQEFGLRWNQDLDRKGVVVGNEIELTLRIVARRESEGAPGGDQKR